MRGSGWGNALARSVSSARRARDPDAGRKQKRRDRLPRSRRFPGFQVRSRPLSRVLSWTTIPLGAASPQRSSSAPGCGSSRSIAPLFGLAPGGVCRAPRRWPRGRCALTAPFHHHHAHLAMPFGCLLSVALSVGSRRPGVTWHLALGSPDFPRRGRAATRLSWPTPRGHCRMGRRDRGRGATGHFPGSGATVSICACTCRRRWIACHVPSTAFRSRRKASASAT